LTRHRHGELCLRPLNRRDLRARVAVAIAIALTSAPARAAGVDDDEDDPAQHDAAGGGHRSAKPHASGDADDARTALLRDAPAAADAPQLRNVEPRTRLYADGALAQSTDLSALPYIAGSGRNVRFALGGSLKLGRFQLDAELPAAQATTLNVTMIPGGVALPPDDHQTALSNGDLRLGAQWTTPLPGDALAMAAGFGLRGRFPTHTTQFAFHQGDGSVALYGFPYYFHIEPAALFGAAWGPLSFVTNQGAIVLMGPDANFQEIRFIVPNVYFWDAHYAVAAHVVGPIGLSTEVNTLFQLNHVGGVDFAKLNHIRAVSVLPGVQLQLGRYRVDAVARFGLTHGAEVFGVIGYSGTRSYTLRATYYFE